MRGTLLSSTCSQRPIHHAGRSLASVDPVNHRTTYGYDPVGRQTEIQDANNKRTTTIYDGAGRDIAVVSALGNRTTATFDSASRKIAIQNARGYLTSFTFDAANRLTEKVDPLGRRTTYGYDAAGQRTLRVDARGNRTTYPYDDVGRVTGRLYPDGSRVTFAYDPVGNRALMQDANGRTTYSHDPENRLSTMTSPAGQILSYAYDGRGARATLDEPTGRFTYSHDPVGRISSLVNPEGERTTFTHDAAGRRTLTQLANGTKASVIYDAADRVTLLANLKSDGSTISSFDYSLDNVGNRTGLVEANGDRVTWTYDDTYQLTREQRSGSNAYDTTYTYDSVGNRLTKVDSGSPTTSTYDAADELTLSQGPGGLPGITAYQYDNNGNTAVVATSTSLTTNTWDYEDRFTQKQQQNGAKAERTYDADGRRVRDRYTIFNIPLETTRFLWDEENVLLETNDSHAIQAIYTLEPLLFGNLLTQRRSAATKYFHFDALGSTSHTTNSAQAIIDAYLYKAFGEVISGVGTTSQPYLYVGRLGYYDNGTNEVYVFNRWFIRLNGRWISNDFLRRDLNPYRYCHNNPTNSVDPSGLDCYSECTKSCSEYSWWNVGGIAGCYWGCSSSCKPTTDPPSGPSTCTLFFVPVGAAGIGAGIGTGTGVGAGIGTGAGAGAGLIGAITPVGWVVIGTVVVGGACYVVYQLCTARAVPVPISRPKPSFKDECLAHYQNCLMSGLGYNNNCWNCLLQCEARGEWLANPNPLLQCDYWNYPSSADLE